MVDMTDTKLPQASVIGSMLIDEKIIGGVLGTVQPEDFLDEPYRKLFLAIRQLFGAGRPVDPVTVLDAMQADPSADWYAFIENAMKLTPTSANIDAYIPILREQARLFRVQHLGGLLQVSRDWTDAQGYISQLNAQLVERPGVKVTTMEQGLADFVERHRTKATYLPWGLRDLDERMYIAGGKFVVLGGYPSDGKTAFALSSAWTMAEKYRVGFFSLETDDGTLIDRLVARVALIDMGRIKKSDLTEEDYGTVAEMSGRMIAHDLEIIPAAGMTVDDIFAQAQSRRYDVIYIDYVQLIRRPKGWKSYEAVSEISRNIQTYAKTTGITVVGLSQLSRPDKSGGKRRAPTMSDLRESGQLEQDADAIMLLYREEPDIPNSRRVLALAKNKEGEVGQIYLNFDGPTQTFRKSFDQTTPPSKKREPEYKQVKIEELPDNTEVPF